jgi:hypothetical protein
VIVTYRGKVLPINRLSFDAIRFVEAEGEKHPVGHSNLVEQPASAVSLWKGVVWRMKVT